MDTRLAFCPPLQEMAAANRRGMSSTNNLLVLRALMQRYQPERTLEIGFAWGASGLAFTSSHRERSEPAKQHIAIDPFQDHWEGAGLATIKRAGLSGYLDFRGEASALVLPQLVREGAMFGLIYVDGSHLFEDVMVDAYYGFRLLTPRGVIAFDDCTSPHVAKVIAFLRTNTPGLEEVDLSLHHPSGATWRYRLARRLNRVQMTAFRRVGPERDFKAPFTNF